MSTADSSPRENVIHMPVMVIFGGKEIVEMTADEFRARHARPGGARRVLFSHASNPHFQGN